MTTFPVNTPVQIGPSIERYKCPVCGNYSNLRWMDEARKVTVLGCNAVCAARMLKLNSNRIASDFDRGLGLITSAMKQSSAFACPRGYGECEDARTCVYPGRCGARLAPEKPANPNAGTVQAYPKGRW